MIRWTIRVVQKLSFAFLAYMLNDEDLTTLSNRLEDKLKAVQQLQAGVLTSNELLDKLEASTTVIDGKIKDLLLKVSDTARVQTVIDQVTTKNDQLQGLVTKLTKPF